MNFSFQYGLLLSSLNITLEVNTSSYHLKSLMVGHLRLLNWSWILKVMLLGVPIKCLIIVKTKELTPSRILIIKDRVTFFIFLNRMFNKISRFFSEMFFPPRFQFTRESCD
jgi:hypothetical protein